MLNPIRTLPSLFLFAGVSSAQTWDTTRPPCPVDYTDYAASVAWQGGENQIFVFGGSTETTIEADVHRYHRTLHWNGPLTPMPAPRDEAASATALDGFAQERIYVIGGRKPGGGVSDDCWAYDPVNDTWNDTLASMPTARKNACAVTGDDGYVYVFGGENSVGTRLDTVERYDPVADAWDIWPDMALPRGDFGAVAACDGYIYLFGGETNSGQTATVEVFEPGVGFLAPAEPMPTVRASMGAAIGRDGRIYIVGGSINSVVPTDSVVSYDPIFNTWDFEDDLPTNRSGLVALGLGSRVWALGGYRKLHPYTGKLEALGILPLASDCTGVVPPLPPKPFGDIATCDKAYPVHADDYVFDVGIDDFTSDWLRLDLADGHELQVLYANHAGDDTARANLWAGCGLGLLDVSQGTGIAGEQQLTYKNDTGMPTSVVVEYTWPGGGNGEQLAYDVRVERSFDSIGTNFCGPAVPNSSGEAAVISASGDTIVADNDFTLHAADLPQNQVGYFIASQNQGFVQGPGGSQGNLCLGGPIARFVEFVGSTGDEGTMELSVDLYEFPTSPETVVVPGETWNFQLWFRDKNPNNTSNFTDALSVAFE